MVDNPHCDLSPYQLWLMEQIGLRRGHVIIAELMRVFCRSLETT